MSHSFIIGFVNNTFSFREKKAPNDGIISIQWFRNFMRGSCCNIITDRKSEFIEIV